MKLAVPALLILTLTLPATPSPPATAALPASAPRAALPAAVALTAGAHLPVAAAPRAAAPRAAAPRAAAPRAAAPRAAAPRAAAPRAARQWTTSGATPIGRPIAVGGVAVGYALRAQRLYARALTPATGAVRWEHEISPSAQPATAELAPVRAGEDVVLLQPEPAFSPQHARLSVVDPATGREVQRSPAMLFSTAPESCFAGRSVCALATPEAGEPVLGYRLNLDSGAFSPYAQDAPQGARGLAAPGLVALGAAPTEQIAQLRDGAQRWRQPLTAIFPRVPAATGTTWNLHATEAVYVGSGYARALRGTTATTLDLATDPISAALDETTGRLLWRQPGTVTDCAGRISLTRRGVRCRYSGKIMTSYANRATTSSHLQVALEGFDPRTGATRWSTPLGAATKLAIGESRLPVADENTIAVNGLLIDLRTGSRAEPAAGQVMWCPKRVRFDLAGTKRLGGEVVSPCDALGRPIATSPAPVPAGGNDGDLPAGGNDGDLPAGGNDGDLPPATLAVGAVAGGFAIVATATGYSGTAIPAAPGIGGRKSTG
ncbi:PQQ-binding-like beta-propeller repeat protein [Actinoplanes sp. NPDC051861]|uniref:outer membrane protein assembly factor BamB family protein n=1 Tax=Actinoplanes sp. NPDC051861 TaxID=3155170 RepID=UPI00341E38AC